MLAVCSALYSLLFTVLDILGIKSVHPEYLFAFLDRYRAHDNRSVFDKNLGNVRGTSMAYVAPFLVNACIVMNFVLTRSEVLQLIGVECQFLVHIVVGYCLILSLQK